MLRLFGSTLIVLFSLSGNGQGRELNKHIDSALVLRVSNFPKQKQTQPDQWQLASFSLHQRNNSPWQQAYSPNSSKIELKQTWATMLKQQQYNWDNLSFSFGVHNSLLGKAWGTQQPFMKEKNRAWSYSMSSRRYDFISENQQRERAGE